MKPKSITATISRQEYVKAYLKLWNGMIGLTDKELDITEAIINKYLDLGKVISDPRLVNEFLFSTQSLKEIRIAIGIKEASLNNYKGSLKEKGVIHVDRDGNYSIDEKLLPVQEITFKFNIR